MRPGMRQVEVELKFPLKDPEEMCKRLIEAGFSTDGRVLEQNIVFDTPTGDLAGGGRLLRLRKDREVRLTFKEPPVDSTHAERFKVKEESELIIADFETMRFILRQLGFTRERIYEKYREHFTRGPGEAAEIDRLPHLGFFLELEAPPESMDRLAADLGLDPSQGLRENYFQLFQEHCRRTGLEFHHMLFEDEQEEK